VNAVTVYTVPPRRVLDAALAAGLWPLVSLPWEQHVAYLESRTAASAVVCRVQEGAAAYRPSVERSSGPRTLYADDSRVESGKLNDPYTAARITFVRGGASEVDIDHVVALGHGWQKGARQWSYVCRVSFANEPPNLLSVDASANRQKSDGDAATFRRRLHRRGGAGVRRGRSSALGARPEREGAGPRSGRLLSCPGTSCPSTRPAAY
jgi:hypothetical protein